MRIGRICGAILVGLMQAIAVDDWSAWLLSSRLRRILRRSPTRSFLQGGLERLR
jgi:hypothetical protein